ncbi:MAG: ATPase with chaperone activity [Rhodoferax sp.]
MYEEYQIEIPQSFMALFVDPGRQKPNASRDEVAARYELCEDMASMLTETAKNMFLELGITEDDVLLQCYGGLTGEGSVVTEPEALWVIHRLAELLEWPFLRTF